MSGRKKCEWAAESVKLKQNVSVGEECVNGCRKYEWQQTVKAVSKDCKRKAERMIVQQKM